MNFGQLIGSTFAHLDSELFAHLDSELNDRTDLMFRKSVLVLVKDT
jgi:hypothetical protein